MFKVKKYTELHITSLDGQMIKKLTVVIIKHKYLWKL